MHKGCEIFGAVTTFKDVLDGGHYIKTTGSGDERRMSKKLYPIHHKCIHYHHHHYYYYYYYYYYYLLLLVRLQSTTTTTTTTTTTIVAICSSSLQTVIQRGFGGLLVFYNPTCAHNNAT